MASEKAKLAKEKGNEAFKAGDYPTAIGHYTTAILADNSDPTFYLNRAAAYLKLGKGEDTERDCTRVLEFNPNNVKGLFRRGQARRGLGNFGGARDDLNRALQLEPSNTAVKNELVEIDKAVEAEQIRLRRSTPKRRRVPIDIVEPEANQKNITNSPSKESKDEALLRPVSSRDLKPAIKQSISNSPPSFKPQTFADAKQARESSKAVRVSGGIFRPSGNHSIITRSPVEPSGKQSTPASTSAISASVLPPGTLFDFTKSWNALNTDDARWELLCTIPPSSISSLFQASLEPGLLQSILHTLRAVFSGNPTTRSTVGDYLAALMKVQRFGTVMLFMDKEERKALETLRQEVST